MLQEQLEELQQHFNTYKQKHTVQQSQFEDLHQQFEADKHRRDREDLLGTAITSGSGIDKTDSGQLIDRTLWFDKHFENTTVQVIYTDNFRTYGSKAGCRWHIKFDGEQCPMAKLYYDMHNRGKT